MYEALAGNQEAEFRYARGARETTFIPIRSFETQRQTKTFNSNVKEQITSNKGYFSSHCERTSPECYQQPALLWCMTEFSNYFEAAYISDKVSNALRLRSN